MVVLATPDLAATSSMDRAANPPSASRAPAAARIARSASWLRGLPRRGAPTAGSAAGWVGAATGKAGPVMKRTYQITATRRSVSNYRVADGGHARWRVDFQPDEV